MKGQKPRGEDGKGTEVCAAMLTQEVQRSTVPAGMSGSAPRSHQSGLSGRISSITSPLCFAVSLRMAAEGGGGWKLRRLAPKIIFLTVEEEIACAFLTLRGIAPEIIATSHRGDPI